MIKAVKFFRKIIFIILLLLPILFVSIKSELIIGDEIWNFQNIMKIINGGTIYKDANVIVTPIFFYVGKVLVKIFGANILGFRIYNALIFTGLLLSVFSIFKMLKIENLKSMIYVLIILLFVMPYISVGANYNVLAIIFYLTGIILFLNKEKIKFYNIYQAIVIYLIIFTKQNIGALYFISICIADIYINRKKAIHSIIRELMITSILVLVSVILMLIEGNFQSFINYTILGMREFTGNNLSIQEKAELIIILYGLMVVVSYLVVFYLYKSNEIKDKKIIVLSIFSIFLNFSAYPIFNLYHTSFAILINIIIFIYIGDILLLNKLQHGKIKFAILIMIYIVINSFSINCGFKTNKNITIEDKNNVYYMANINEKLYENLQNVSEYILKKEAEGIDVICISSDAALYMTYLNKNHQELDLIFEGNLGYKGKEKTIEKIKGLENVEILMNKSSYWQELTDLRSHVISNYKRINTIGDCYVFQELLK